jgi:hypothetical protein
MAMQLRQVKYSCSEPVSNKTTGDFCHQIRVLSDFAKGDHSTKDVHHHYQKQQRPSRFGSLTSSVSWIFIHFWIRWPYSLWNLPSKLAVACLIELPMPSSGKDRKGINLGIWYRVLPNMRPTRWQGWSRLAGTLIPSTRDSFLVP